MNTGHTNSEACRIVAFNRRTGSRWRYGRTVNNANGATYHQAAVNVDAELGLGGQVDAKPSRYLSGEERIAIADGKSEGLTKGQIAERLGRSPATNSRELRRNVNPTTGRYAPATADRIALGRGLRPKAPNSRSTRNCAALRKEGW